MSNIFGNWFSSDNFSAWKLHTVWDYAFFFFILLIGIAVFVLAQRRINRGRTQEASIKRVAKRLQKLGGKNAQSFCGIKVSTKRESADCDIISVCNDAVYVVKVIWWGLTVTGSADDDEWTIACNKEYKRIENPLPDLLKSCEITRRMYAESDIHGIPVKPLVVVADNFGYSHCHMRGTDAVVAYQDLGKWRKAHPLGDGKKINMSEAVLPLSLIEDLKGKKCGYMTRRISENTNS